MATVEILNPVSQLDAELKESAAAAPRPNTLEGKRIGLHWNRKPGGIYFLRRLETLLNQRIPGVQVTQYHTPAPIAKDVAQEIASKSDVVVMAQAD